ncbi:hypothetical protein G9A89_006106 [Geosiphon pyriformis]|nr:hypothetical protein G9A89_006106 [Geosiphon pyriformis]
MDKSRLAAIYAKHLALVTHSVAFGGVFWAKIAGKSLFFPLSVGDIMMEEGLSVTTSGKAAVSLELSSFLDIIKFENINLKGVEKTIDYIFVSDSLSSAVADQIVTFVSDYFDTNYKAVMVSVGLGGLLDVHLNVRFSSVVREFLVTGTDRNFDFMWSLLVKVLVNSADETFFRHWFCEVKYSSNKQSSKFFKLELLVAKVVKSLQSGNASKSGFLLNAWLNANESKALEVQNMLNSNANSADIFVCLSRFRKNYHCSKIHKAKAVEAATIRHAIDKRIENFCTDKSSIIKSILDKPFYKMVFDHLVIDNKLVLDPSKYVLLQYVNDDAFSNIMDVIGFDELSQVVKHLPDKKTAGLSGILNELWKHCDEIIFRKTAHKILSKIFSNQIFLACSKFGVLHGDNFFILQDIFTQSPIFAVGSVVEDALEKGREVWSSQAATQFILDIRVQKAVLKISGLPILIAKHGVSHRYLGIFLSTDAPSNSNSLVDVNNVLLLEQFFAVKNDLLEVWSDSISVFTDGSLKGLGFVDVTGGAAVFFAEIGLGIGVRVVGLLSFTMTEF